MKTIFTKRAVKAVSRMDVPTKQRIHRAISRIPDGDVKPLKGASNAYRVRVGDWRILFTYPADGVVQIEKIEPRGQVYKEV